MGPITPSLWFDTEALEAAEFYTSVFPNSELGSISYYNEAGPGEAGTVLTVEFTLDGRPFLALNGGPKFKFDEAISFMVECADQTELDYYWDTLVAGGEPGQCGWLKDRFGLSWQIVPAGMAAVLGDPDPGRSERSMKAMLGMSKIDMAALAAAADG